MSEPSPSISSSAAPWVWVCFALPEEARPLRARLGRLPGVEIVLTGIGPEAARRSIQSRLARQRPACVLSCGLAGGLDPRWPAGTVLFASADPFWARRFHASGARPGRFCAAEHVLRTASEKAALFQVTHADAVEMESGPIQALCQNLGIPCAVVRAISDTAREDLPLDFQRYVRSDGTLDRWRLVREAWMRPGCWAGLLRLQARARAAARRLAEVLEAALCGWQQAVQPPRSGGGDVQGPI
ncbi:MAG: hypothetical protein N2438_12520 [Limisphaera sp.]|nr:hypothetical protein [Limisphaera sp.]